MNKKSELEIGNKENQNNQEKQGDKERFPDLFRLQADQLIAIDKYQKLAQNLPTQEQINNILHSGKRKS